MKYVLLKNVRTTEVCYIVMNVVLSTLSFSSFFIGRGTKQNKYKTGPVCFADLLIEVQALGELWGQVWYYLAGLGVLCSI